MDFPLEEIKFGLQLFSSFKDDIKNIVQRILNRYSEFREKHDESDTERDECIWEVIHIIARESEIKKSERIEKFAEKTIMDPDCDLDNSTVLFLLSKIEVISWRQLCFIEGFRQNRQGAIDINSITNGSGLNTSTRIAEIRHLRDLGYLKFPDQWPNVHRSYSQSSSELVSLTDEGTQLCELMELQTIPPEEINKAFTVWGIKREYR